MCKKWITQGTEKTKVNVQNICHQQNNTKSIEIFISEILFQGKIEIKMFEFSKLCNTNRKVIKGAKQIIKSNKTRKEKVLSFLIRTRLKMLLISIQSIKNIYFDV